MDDLIQEFIEETSESLSALDNEMVRLEQNPDDAELIGSIFRLVHTVKGTCGFLGLPRLASVAHAAENVLGKIRDNTLDVTPEAISLILEAFDRIKELMEHLEEEGAEPEGDDSDLITRLDVCAGEVEDADMDAMFGEQMAMAAESEAEPVALEGALGDADAEANAEMEMMAAEEVGEPDASEEVAVDFDESDPEAIKAAWAAITAGDADDSASSEETPEGTTDTETETHSEEECTAAAEEPAETTEVDPAKKESSDVTAPAPVQKPAISETAKKKAVEEGLKTEVKQTSGKSAQSIRVSIDVLEDLMQMVSELVLTRNQLNQLARSEVENSFRGPIQRLSHITTELQEGVMKTRMQPIGSAWAKFPRLIRDLSLELDKKIELVMSGEETELDRQLLDFIKDPLTHMVRNSVDHGLEKPEERIAAGKPETGKVSLSAYHEGGHIIIKIQDDGRGLNLERIREKIVEKGLASEDDVAQMNDSRIMHHIFHPGFSTAEQVTSVSGRGVGMDVVKSNIEKIGGTIELFSEQGKGSTFLIKIPLTLAIVSVLIVEAEQLRFAIPQINVVELVCASPDSEYYIETINHTPVMRLRQKLLPLISLPQILGMSDVDPAAYKNQSTYVVICNVGGVDFGVIVDRVYDTEEIVVKPVAPILQNIDLYAGTTILGDGSVIMILDPNGLLRRIGDVQVGGEPGADEAEQLSYSQRDISFLLFATKDDTPKAVPLDLVSRLEEIEPERVEQSSGHSVVQYRGQLMRLLSFDDELELNEEGAYSVVVFSYEGHLIGMVVREILDIVQAQLKIRMASDDPRLIGSMVINDVTTDVIDTANILSTALGELYQHQSTEEQKRTVRGSILIVDDSNFFRNLSAPYLSARGFEVVTANGAVEALELMAKGARFDLIISDIEMPDMNGIEFARHCQSDTNYRSIPMIAYSSNLQADIVKEGMEAGFKAYVSKTDRDGLLREVEAIL